jgi:hypothetical protein
MFLIFLLVDLEGVFEFGQVLELLVYHVQFELKCLVRVRFFFAVVVVLGNRIGLV